MAERINPQLHLHMPQLKNCYHVEWVEPDGIFLLTENAFQHRLLRSRIYAALIPLLNGLHSSDEIVAALGSRFSPPEVLYALAQLQSQGLVVEALVDEDVPPPVRAFWQLLDADARDMGQRLSSSAVMIKTVGGVDDAPLRDTILRLGMKVVADSAASAITVVVTNDYLRPELNEINAQALRTGRPWMLVKLTGAISWIGPVFTPGQTACWRCLAQRLEDNRQVETYLLRNKSQAIPFPTSRVQLPTIIGAAANLTATELLKWLIASDKSELVGKLITFDALNTDIQWHTLVRRPQCAACGDSRVQDALKQPKPVQLRFRSGSKRAEEAEHRTTTPEATFAQFKHHISPITGVVSALVKKASADDTVTYQYTASHNFVTLRDDMKMLRQNVRGQSGGKGNTDIKARVSAMAEAIERYSGVYRGDEPVVRGSYQQLAPQAVHVNECLLFSESQYANRHDWNRQRSSEFQIVPNPFDPTLEIDWAPCWSFATSAFKYVPTAYCYYGHPDVLNKFYCGSDSNGCASGNTLEEAILHGFLELAERDATALWWYNRISRPGVDVRSFGLPYFDQLVEHYRTLNRNLWVLDLTADLGIPVFAAISSRLDNDVEDIVYGIGAHLDARIAVMHALTEVNQLLMAVSSRNIDGSTRYMVRDDEMLQ